MKHPSTGTVVLFGSAVKAQGEGKVGGHLVLFGDEASKDLSGEFFTASTDFDTEFPGKSSVYFHHALDPTLKAKKLTTAKAEIGVDDTGVWIEGVLDMRDEYAAAVYKMVDEGKLGWSSGTAAHLIGKKSTGEIEYWPLGLDASLTPTPCDSRNLASSIKSYSRPLKTLSAPTFDQLRGIKSEGMSQDDKQSILNRALNSKMEAAGFWGYVYVYDVFDASMVFRMGDKYYESPYTLSGFVATIGEPTEVQRITRYEPLQTSAAGKTDEVPPVESALKSARDLFDRLRSDSEDTAREGLKTLHRELGDLLQGPERMETKSRFEAEVAAALRFAA